MYNQSTMQKLDACMLSLDEKKSGCHDAQMPNTVCNPIRFSCLKEKGEDGDEGKEEAKERVSKRFGGGNNAR